MIQPLKRDVSDDVIIWLVVKTTTLCDVLIYKYHVGIDICLYILLVSACLKTVCEWRISVDLYQL